MSFKGSETEKNLKSALAGESMARNKYTYYAMAAREQGFDAVADVFERLAMNEMHHAKLWFEYLNGKPKTTVTNLQEAATGEFDEWHSMYPKFAQKAREEGYEEIAKKFEGVAAIERDHELQFMKLFGELLAGKKVEESAKEELKTYQGHRCMFCGAVYENRPDVCGVCQAIGSFEDYQFQK